MALSRINHTGAAPTTGLASSITAGATSLTLLSGTGYPTTNFVLKIDEGTTSEEKILVGTRSGATCSSLTRGYDNTVATSHSAASTNVEHCFTAAEADDNNDHVYTTTRDDHTQYARTDGTRAVTGNQTFSGGLTVSAGGATVSSGGATITGGLTVDGGALVSQPPAGLAHDSTGLALSNGSNGLLALGASDKVQGGMALTSGKLVVPNAGLYLVTGRVSVQVATNTMSLLDCFIAHNGTVVHGSDRNAYTVPVGNFDWAAVTALLVCSTNDTIELWGRADSSSTQHSIAGANTTYLHAVRVST